MSLTYGGRTVVHRHRKPLTIQADGRVLYDCGHEWVAETAKRGRNNRARGGRAELAIAREYGGEKVGPLGLGEDIRGKTWATQVKVSQRAAPPMWLREFAKLANRSDGRTPRLILRFSRQGVKAEDFVVIRGSDWLAWFGRDE